MATTVEDLYRQILGREPEAEGLAFWQNAFGGSVDPMEQASFMQAAQAELARRTPAEQAVLAPNLVSATTAPPAVTNADILGWFNANPNADATLVNQTMQAAGVPPSQVSSALASNPEIAKTYLTQQILGQGTADKWTGEGKGSAQANAADMANILAGIGITDINQFGQIQKTVVDEDGNKSVVTTYGNKVTGQEVPNTYSERQTGNAFGGTFAGKGNTGYRVEFAPNGTPVFYTTGASSSDVGDWMPIVQLALAATGAGGLLGNALLGTGASQIASSALGNAILGGATTGLAGGDVLKGALLGGAGGALSGYLQGANGVTLGNASDIAIEMADAGSTLAEIEASLASRGFGADVIADSLKDATNAMLPKAANVPMDGSSLVDTVNVVAPSGAPAISTNALTNILSQIPNIVDVSNIFKAGAPPPNIEVKDTRPIKSDIPVITTTSPPVGTTPTVTNPTGTVPTTKDTSLTPSDVIKILGIGTTIAGINAATGGGGTSGGVQYPIVDVPANWATPPKTGVAPATVLPPINFGDRNLLIGTQWEKFLDPNYGQVPEPIQYSQPSSLSYNDLMGILGSKQGYPAKSSLSINDIISGIQNQYGQAPSSAMG